MLSARGAGPARAGPARAHWDHRVNKLGFGLIVAPSKSGKKRPPTDTAGTIGRTLFLAVAFTSGWVIMMLEILGGRVLAPYFGYSVYQWGALIGVVMSALALGYHLGGRVGDRPNARSFLLGAFALAAVFVLVVPRLAADFMPAMRAFGPAWGAVLASAVLLGVPSVLLATVSPIVIRLTATSRIAASAGSVYAVSTVGSIGGTFFTAFYVIPDLGSLIGHYVAASLLVAAAAALALAARRLTHAAALGAVLAIGYPFAPAPEPGVIYSTESLHNIIRVEETGSRRTLYLNYRDGAQTVMDTRQLLTGSYYDQFLIGPHLNGGRKILFLGVAGGTSLKQLVTAYPEVEITGIDLDPAVLDVARNYFGLAGEERVRLVAEDARWFLGAGSERFDVIAIDLYVTGHIPFFTTTREFFELVHARLAEDGVMMMNVLVISERRRDELLGPFIRTVRTVFPSAFLIGSGNYILIASKTPISLAAMRRKLARPGAGREIEIVLRRARPGLRVASAARKWPVFTDDLNDVEFRTFRTFYGRD